MSFSKLIDDVKEIEVTELDGITSNPSSAMNVQANTDGSFSLVAGGGGGSSGFASPSGGTFQMSDTTNADLGSGFETLSLVADSSDDTTFYIAGGVEYRSYGNSSNRGLYMTNPTGILNGHLDLFTGGLPAVSSQASPAFRTTMVWNNTTNGFVGFPVQSTFHGNATNTFMAWGANGTSFTPSGKLTNYILSTSLSGSLSNINVGLLHGGTISGTITVDAGQTVAIGLQTTNSNGNRSRLFANKLS